MSYAHQHSTRFEHLLATHAHLQTIQCLHLSTPTSAHEDRSAASSSAPLIITSHSSDRTQAMSIRCPRGGVSFVVDSSWRQESGSVHVKTQHERHEVTETFALSAKQTDWTSSAVTIVADRMRLQSSTSPFDIHSFSTHAHGLALRCPKGGMILSSGSAGIQYVTSGNMDLQLTGDQTHLRLASRGHKAHTIHLGNAATETVVENQLTVKGKLVLADDTVLEKRVSVVHELQNVVELGGARTTTTTSSSSSPSSSSSSTSSTHPDAQGFDFGLVARQNNSKSGVVYDHIRKLFYFANDLGTYQHHRFALPSAYADVQARIFLAQQKIQAPFIDAHSVQCRSLRSNQVLTLQAPRVQCTQKLACASVQSDLSQCVQQKSHATTTDELDVTERATVTDLHVTGGLTIGTKDQLFHADLWWFNTVGPHGAHRTLQDYIDASEDVRARVTSATSATSPSSPSPASPTTDHAVMQSTSIPHSCNALINQPQFVLDGRHSILTGVLEITEECESFLLTDCRAAHLTLTSSAEYKRDTPRPSTYVLRNVHGTAKDWCFDLPEGVLRLESCQLTFLNQVLGKLKRVDVVQSVVRGGPWRGVEMGGRE